MTSVPPDVNAPIPSNETGKLPELLIGLLREFAYWPDKYRARVDTNFGSGDPSARRVHNGHLEPMQLLMLLTATSGGFYVPTDFSSNLLQRLIEWDLAHDTNDLQGGGRRISLNKKTIKIYDALGILENCVRGLDFVFAKYSKATPAIIIEKQGTEHLGTGLFVRFGSPDNYKFFILTNKHVVDPNDSITIKRIELLNSEVKNMRGDWRLSTADDLAAIEIDHSPDQPYFCLAYQVTPLQRVITFGYPKIPFADDAYLAFHSGEINIVFRTTLAEEMFLISNQVGPGSSGGPVMDNKGLLVGVTAKAFQGRMEPDASYVISWNAAITFKRIRTFLGHISGIPDWTANAENWLETWSPTPSDSSS